MLVWIFLTDDIFARAGSRSCWTRAQHDALDGHVGDASAFRIGMNDRWALREKLGRAC